MTAWQADRAGTPAVQSVAVATTSGEGPLELEWDGRGQLRGDGNRLVLDWTADGLIAVASDSDTKDAEHRVYDALGRLVRVRSDRVASGEANHVVDFVYDGISVVEEHAGDDTGWCGRRTWFLAEGLDQAAGYELDVAGCTEPQRVALQAESVDSGFAGVHRFALWQDLHADARLVVDESGAVVEAYACDVFGACDVAYADGAVCDGSDACPSRVGNPIRFAGARLLPTSGLLHMRARDYDPILRTFLSRESIGFDRPLRRRLRPLALRRRRPAEPVGPAGVGSALGGGTGTRAGKGSAGTGPTP